MSAALTVKKRRALRFREEDLSQRTQSSRRVGKKNNKRIDALFFSDPLASLARELFRNRKTRAKDAKS